MIKHTQNKQLLVTSVGQLNITLCGDRGWTDDEWTEHLKNNAAVQLEAGNITGGLIYSPHRAPTAKQRQEAADSGPRLGANPDQMTHIAIISDSVLVRGAMVAVGWLGLRRARIKPFAPGEIEQAFSWLAKEVNFDKTEATRVLEQMRAMSGT